jgi:hypothetical protein
VSGTLALVAALGSVLLPTINAAMALLATVFSRLGSGRLRPLLHLLPELREGPRPPALPRRRPTPAPPLAHEYALAAAERLAQLDPVIAFALRRVRAELERTARLAVGAGFRGHDDGASGVEWMPFSTKAQCQMVAVCALKPSMAVAGPIPTVSEVQQEKHVRNELLCARVERSPPRRWRNPQIVLAR